MNISKELLENIINANPYENMYLRTIEEECGLDKIRYYNFNGDIAVIADYHGSIFIYASTGSVVTSVSQILNEMYLYEKYEISKIFGCERVIMNLFKKLRISKPYLIESVYLFTKTPSNDLRSNARYAEILDLNRLLEHYRITGNIYVTRSSLETDIRSRNIYLWEENDRVIATLRQKLSNSQQVLVGLYSILWDYRASGIENELIDRFVLDANGQKEVIYSISQDRKRYVKESDGYIHRGQWKMVNYL